ncbi:hypothetical protein BDZ89DRAFT_324339 [Hymenopellis radicata]|nr:hypothetical protein BDZ89DRAFT_324339 [Hymenopellis radicata]
MTFESRTRFLHSVGQMDFALMSLSRFFSGWYSTCRRPTHLRNSHIGPPQVLPKWAINTIALATRQIRAKH